MDPITDATMLTAVLDVVDVGIVAVDRDGGVIARNDRSRRLLGDPDGDETRRLLARTLEDGEVNDLEVPTTTTDGRRCRLVIQGRSLRLDDGTPWAAVITARDVTGVRLREAELSARLREIEALSEASRSILTSDGDQAACEAVRRVTGAQHVSLLLPDDREGLVVSATTETELDGIRVPLSGSSRSAAAFRRGEPLILSAEAAAEAPSCPIADVIIGRHGTIRGVLYLPLRSTDDVLGVLLLSTATEVAKLPARLFGILEILTVELALSLDRRRLTAQLASQAATDALTGLPNRRAWDSRLRDLLAADPQPACLAIVDLDHFKAYNDAWGHQAGDSLLVSTARALGHGLRTGDLLARLGGEEFGVLLPGCELSDGVTVLNGLMSRCPAAQTVSIGVAERRDGEPLEEWFARADAALYLAKSRGRAQVAGDAGDP